MEDPLFSQEWYRVSHLAPRVRSGIESAQHIYRGQAWFVLRGTSYGESLRINATAFYVMKKFNGQTKVSDIWQDALVTLGDDAPTQGEMIELLVKLFDVDVIDFEQTSDLDQLFENRQNRDWADTKSRYGNPLFMRFKLYNPNSIAQSLVPVFGRAFSSGAMVFWLFMIVLASVAGFYVWPELSQSLSSDLASRRNLLILWFVFPLMKLIHELAHAVAIRKFGGEVTECGIALLVLLPVPYVDGSDSARFSSKFQRMAVAGAGIMVETALACVGLAVWMVVEPGLIRDIALNVVITGTLSSLLFNGNPLLKFDAYYVLSDFLEIPNLAARSARYPLYLFQRYILGIESRSPATAPGERRWLITYGLMSLVYRFVLTVVICAYVASQYFFIGVILAIWATLAQLGKPIWTLFKFLWSDSRVRNKRIRVNVISTSFAAAFVFFVFFFQLPNVTAVRGVVWPEEQAVIRTGVDCFVKSVEITNGERIETDSLLLECEDAQLDAELAVLRADYQIARAALDSSRDRADRQVLRTKLELTRELLHKAEDKQGRMLITSALDGEVHFPNAKSLKGRYLKQGQLVGYVLNPDNISIRTLMGQDRVELLDGSLEQLDVRLLRNSHTQSSRIVRRVPAASSQLDIAALGEHGGGHLLEVTDGDGESRLRQAAFEFEVALPDEFLGVYVGEPVELRFTHGYASPAAILYRKVQLLLLSKFNV